MHQQLSWKSLHYLATAGVQRCGCCQCWGVRDGLNLTGGNVIVRFLKKKRTEKKSFFQRHVTKERLDDESVKL